MLLILWIWTPQQFIHVEDTGCQGELSVMFTMRPSTYMIFIPMNSGDQVLKGLTALPLVLQSLPTSSQPKGLRLTQRPVFTTSHHGGWELAGLKRVLTGYDAMITTACENASVGTQEEPWLHEMSSPPHSAFITQINCKNKNVFGRVVKYLSW